jgi:hypothetical protein
MATRSLTVLLSMAVVRILRHRRNAVVTRAG